MQRLSGSGRYETAAAVSASFFDPGVPVAYVATGLSFPDALAGGAAAASTGGPVLLVDRDAVPAATEGASRRSHVRCGRARFWRPCWPGEVLVDEDFDDV